MDPGRQLLKPCITQYQALQDHGRIGFKTSTINPATLLPNNDLEIPIHYCFEIITTQGIFPDKTHSFLKNPYAIIYTDRSNSVKDWIG